MGPDLDLFWKRLHATPAPTQEHREIRGWDLRSAITRAAEKANDKLKRCFKDFDPKIVSEVATTSVRCFLEAWYDELHAGDTVNLIAVVMEGSDLTVEELHCFVKALPTSLLKRICENPSPSASGLQALLAIESERRKGNTTDYDLSRDPLDGKVRVTFHPIQAFNTPISFRLDETFEIKTNV